MEWRGKYIPTWQREQGILGSQTAVEGMTESIGDRKRVAFPDRDWRECK